MKSTAAPTIVLLGVVLGAGGFALGKLGRLSAAAAEQRSREHVEATLMANAPGEYDNDPLVDCQVRAVTPRASSVPVKVARHRYQLHGAPTGSLSLLRAPGGFGGPIKLIVVADAAGKVTRVSVLAHTETAGFGDAIDADKGNWGAIFIDSQLAGTTTTQWQVRTAGGSFDAISGATVTSGAMVAGVYDALRADDAALTEESCENIWRLP
ncbi:MAG: FMN-binding protein [Gammaproteobacteria bacterium]|nr:FMN-binding protein [Gammaproteobacteria bacterium]